MVFFWLFLFFNFIFWDFCMWMLCFYPSHLPIKPLLCLPSPNLWTLYYCYIYMHLYMYINMHTCIYNLLSPFNAPHMCMCPGLRLGIWHPRSELIHGETVLSLRTFNAAALLELEPCGVFPIYNGMSAGVAILLVLFRQLYCQNSCACFPVMPGGHIQQGILASGSYNLPTPFHDVPWAFSVGIALLRHALVWGIHSSLFFPLWAGVAFCNALCCKKELPWWGVRAVHICACTQKYLGCS